MIHGTDRVLSQIDIALTDRFCSRLEALELALTPATVPACPDWCEKPEGHEYDSTEFDMERFGSLSDAVDAGEIILCRYHRHTIRGTKREEISVEQLEQAAVRADAEPVVTLDEPTVYACIGFEDVVATDDVRGLASDLTAAADLVVAAKENQTAA